MEVRYTSIKFVKATLNKATVDQILLSINSSWRYFKFLSEFKQLNINYRHSFISGKNQAQPSQAKPNQTKPNQLQESFINSFTGIKCLSHMITCVLSC